MILLYHVTERESAKDIIINGFLPNRIYFCTKRYVLSWAKTITCPFRTDLVVVEVGITPSYYHKNFMEWDYRYSQVAHAQGHVVLRDGILLETLFENDDSFFIDKFIPNVNGASILRILELTEFNDTEQRDWLIDNIEMIIPC